MTPKYFPGVKPEAVVFVTSRVPVRVLRRGTWLEGAVDRNVRAMSRLQASAYLHSPTKIRRFEFLPSTCVPRAELVYKPIFLTLQTEHELTGKVVVTRRNCDTDIRGRGSSQGRATHAGGRGGVFWDLLVKHWSYRGSNARDAKQAKRFYFELRHGEMVCRLKRSLCMTKRIT